MLLTGKELLLLQDRPTSHFTIYQSSSKYFVEERNDQYRYMIMNIISV